MRADVREAIDGIKNTISGILLNHNDLERRFQDHVAAGNLRDRIKIEFNPINRMFQWSITALRYSSYYSSTSTADTPYAEGRSDTYEDALAAVIYHEALHRLGLPTKPNGVTKNY